jgi:hypothetical protein
LETRAGSTMTIPGLVRPRRAKLIAIRWSS